jgi:hypothetical protein
LFRNRGSREKVALALGACVILQEMKLPACFHALRHNPHVQALAQADDGLNDAGIVAV